MNSSIKPAGPVKKTRDAKARTEPLRNLAGKKGLSAEAIKIEDSRCRNIYSARDSAEWNL
ncbi:hypothetical protein [Hydrogenivirga sp.]